MSRHRITSITGALAVLAASALGATPAVATTFTDPSFDNARCFFTGGGSGCAKVAGDPVAADLRSLDVAFLEGASPSATDDALRITLSLDTNTGTPAGESGVFRGDKISVDFDTDNNPATGNEFGAEWAFIQQVPATGGSVSTMLYKFAPGTNRFNPDREIQFTGTDGPTNGTIAFTIPLELIQATGRPRTIRVRAGSNFNCDGDPSGCQSPTKTFYDSLPETGTLSYTIPSPPAPLVSAIPSEAITTRTSLQVAAHVETYGFQGRTTVRMEYRVAGASAWQSGPSEETTGGHITLRATGLRPGTAYEYRLVASNSGETGVRTAASDPAQRASTEAAAIGGDIETQWDGRGRITKFALSKLEQGPGIGPITLSVSCVPGCGSRSLKATRKRIAVKHLLGRSVFRPTAIIVLMRRPGAPDVARWIESNGRTPRERACTGVLGRNMKIRTARLGAVHYPRVTCVR